MEFKIQIQYKQNIFYYEPKNKYVKITLVGNCLHFCKQKKKLSKPSKSDA